MPTMDPKWFVVALLCLIAAARGAALLDSTTARPENVLELVQEATKTQEGAAARWTAGKPRADYIGTDVATISWPAPSVQLLGLKEALNISGYSVVAVHGNQQLTRVVTAGSTALSARLTNLKPKTKYQVQVVTQLKSGGSTNAGPSASFETKADLPGPMAKPVASDISQNSLKLSWQPPSTDGGAPIVYYKLGMQQGSSSHPDFAAIVLNGVILEHTEDAKTSMHITGLEPGVKYAFNVKAVNAVGEGPTSPGSDQVTTPEPQAPSQPGKPFISDVTADGMTLKWHPANPLGEPIYAYQILSKRTGDSEFLQFKDLVPVRDLEHFGSLVATRLEVPRGTVARYQVRAVNKKGYGAVSEATAQTSTLVTVPSATEAPVVSKVTSNSAHLSWSTPNGNGGKVTGYRILIQKGSNGGFVELAKTKGDTSYDVTGLEYGGHAYQFKIQAMNDAGLSKPSSASDTIATKNDDAGDTKKQILDEYSKQNFTEVRNNMERYKWDLAKAKLEAATATAVAKRATAQAKKAKYEEQKLRLEMETARANFESTLVIQKKEAMSQRAMDAKATEQERRAEKTLSDATLKSQKQKTDKMHELSINLKDKLTDVEQQRNEALKKIRVMRREGCRRGFRKWCTYQHPDLDVKSLNHS